jgi:hypothetical protein
MEYVLKLENMKNNLSKKHSKVVNSKRLRKKGVHGDKFLVTLLKLSTQVAQNPLLKGAK